MVLDQTDLYHLKDQSQTLTENKENDDGGQYKTCLLSPPPEHPLLAPECKEKMRPPGCQVEDY